jgi:hypothetical protein
MCTRVIWLSSIVEVNDCWSNRIVRPCAMQFRNCPFLVDETIKPVGFIGQTRDRETIGHSIKSDGRKSLLCFQSRSHLSTLLTLAHSWMSVPVNDQMNEQRKTVDDVLMSMHRAIPCVAPAGYVLVNGGLAEWGKLAGRMMGSQIQHPLIGMDGKSVDGRTVTSSLVRMGSTDQKTDQSRRLHGFLVCYRAQEWIVKVEDLDHLFFFVSISFGLTADGQCKILSSMGCAADGQTRLLVDGKGVTYDRSNRQLGMTIDSGDLTLILPPNPIIKPPVTSAQSNKMIDYSFHVD